MLRKYYTTLQNISSNYKQILTKQNDLVESFYNKYIVFDLNRDSANNDNVKLRNENNKKIKSTKEKVNKSTKNKKSVGGVAST